jgi:hypothetical protein
MIAGMLKMMEIPKTPEAMKYHHCANGNCGDNNRNGHCMYSNTVVKLDCCGIHIPTQSDPKCKDSETREEENQRFLDESMARDHEFYELCLPQPEVNPLPHPKLKVKWL